MKRLITSLALALTMSFASISSALAATFWEVQMFEPTQAITSNTFNVEYKVFSTEASDTFTVQLFQNDASIGTQTTTKAYGDSGVFTVTVPAVGTYRYHVSALRNGSEEVKSTPDRTMTVTTTPQGTTNTIFVPATAGGAGGGAGGGGGAGAGAPAVAGAAGQAGGVAGAGDQAATGTTSGATTGTGDVLGAEKQDAADDKKGTSAGERALMIGLPLLALAIAYYFLLHREGHGPLAGRLKSKQ